MNILPLHIRIPLTLPLMEGSPTPLEFINFEDYVLTPFRCHLTQTYRLRGDSVPYAIGKGTLRWYGCSEYTQRTSQSEWKPRQLRTEFQTLLLW